jgi:hypothetical protein
MPPKAQQQQFKSTNTHKVFNQDTLKIIKTTPIKSNAIQTTVSSGPIIIKTPNLPNTEPIQQTQKIILPASTQSTIISSNILPNTETPKEEQDNTMTYVLIGAVIIGFIILQNKDI